jgi:hypothetical protein
MMARHPVAYLRRRSADANAPGDVSRQVQEEAVRGVAHKDGHNGDLRMFVDWSKSASEQKTAHRTE